MQRGDPTRPGGAEAVDGPRIRELPEDFIVEELPLYEPSGEGGHTFLWVEKRESSTEEVARALARFASVANRDVGYAGRKDRRAVTRQWFSVPELDPDRALAFRDDRARVLRAVKHRHKLRVGQLRGNRFELCVRGVGTQRVPLLRRRLEEIERIGFPNHFGRQRYGRDGANPERARAALEETRRPRDRRHLRFLLSSLQASVFDAALAERPTPLDRVERGEVAQVCASGGPFLVEDIGRENERAARFEISATGPIFGSRQLAPTGAPGARERALQERFGVDDLKAKARVVRLRGARRPVLAALSAPKFREEGEGLCLRFDLAAGCYATVFLEALFGEPVDDAPARASVPSRSAGDPSSPAEGGTGG